MSNGLVEKSVQTVKSSFYKAREEGADLYKALIIYRNTPLTRNMQSPMQILQTELPGHSYQCLTVLEDSLIWRLRSSE